MPMIYGDGPGRRLDLLADFPFTLPFPLRVAHADQKNGSDVILASHSLHSIRGFHTTIFPSQRC